MYRDGLIKYRGHGGRGISLARRKALLGGFKATGVNAPKNPPVRTLTNAQVRAANLASRQRAIAAGTFGTNKSQFGRGGVSGRTQSRQAARRRTELLRNKPPASFMASMKFFALFSIS